MPLPTLMVMDGNNISMASHFAMPELRSSAGFPTGAVYGTIKTARNILDRFLPLDKGGGFMFVVAWDSKPCWREQHLATYKATRKTRTRTQEYDRILADYGSQLPKLKDLLKALGIHQIAIDGYEADDCAGHIIRKVRQPGQSVMLISNDHDWLQLVNEGVGIWQPTKDRTVGLRNFEQVIGLPTPNDYRKMMGIIGDSGDDVPNCPGVGEAFAKKFLLGKLTHGEKYNSIVNWIKNPDGFAKTYQLVDLVSEQHPPGIIHFTKGEFNSFLVEGDMRLLSFNSLTNGPGVFDKWLLPFRKLV